MKKELEEMVKTDAYREKYMRGIAQIKVVLDEYEARSRQEEGSSPIQVVDYRIKSAESIADKLEKKGYAISFESAERYLSDLAGVRVVCTSEKDVYALEEYLYKREDLVILRRKDYIKNPKENGYKSLHLIMEIRDAEHTGKVRVELQLRTQAMHCWAEADHRLCYKTVTNVTKRKRNR